MVGRIAGPVLIVLVALAFAVSPARADSPSGVVGSYVAGWNMVGGPPDTNFSAATIFDAYSPGVYFSPPSQLAALCQGYWANFITPAVISLPLSTGPTQSCSLGAGWNLIGNPFSGEASLPTGTLGYYWNTDRGAYDNVTRIPPGGAVWIYSTSPSILTLTYVPTVTRSPITVEIDNVGIPGPYTIHVGDSIKLLLPLATPFNANADPAYLHLESSGESGDLSCISGPACSLSLVNEFWIWHAVAPGATTITVAPGCLSATPPCAAPSYVISVIILP